MIVLYYKIFLTSPLLLVTSFGPLLRTLRPFDRTKRGLAENTAVGKMANVLDFNTKSTTPRRLSFFPFKMQGKGKVILLAWYLINVATEGKLIPPFSKE